MNVKGKVALITGSADGIGKAVAEALFEAGAEIIMVDANSQLLNQTADEERQKPQGSEPHRIDAYVLDVTDGKKVREVVKEIVAAHGTIDILVNCAGVISSHPLLALDEEEWDRVMNVNLKGMFLVTQSVLAEMVRKKQGKIVNIGSDLSSNGQPLLAHYTASKHGVLGFTRSVALEFAPHGILVNTVCPGPTETRLHHKDVDMQVSYTGVTKEAHMKKEVESIPLKKLGKPREVARMVLFLVSEENTHITGEAINVCGGLVMH
jgi:NAD(P)-dependent dehydrogenase (short-subunit alcohol dehydrogenase family)